MRIHEITFTHRNDFDAIMVCEHCGHTQENKAGYDDHYYHTRVIPDMKCRACDKKRNDVSPNQPTTQTEKESE